MSRCTINAKRILGKRNKMIYGHFLEHFHRQIYNGIFDPGSPFADEDGFREDVIEALRQIKTPVIRWPGGCFVSTYDWKKGVGSNRIQALDKTWRVVEPNTFGTDEFIKFCRKVDCEPYICTNAGTGTAEEMSDWVEYCNLEHDSVFADLHNANNKEPYKVKYWSIGNENYGLWELGGKSPTEWGRYVLEAAKMMRRVDPDIELSAAAINPNLDVSIDGAPNKMSEYMEWNTNLLSTCGHILDWISIHEYWDEIWFTNDLATYEQVMCYTLKVNDSIERIEGLLKAMGLERKIKISFDEWNLRGWYHPYLWQLEFEKGKKEYLSERDKNDDNSSYTMADAVFSACFLNTCNRNYDIVGMANFAPVVNTRGAIFTHKGGIVKRTTYHVFDLYVNYLGDTILDAWEENKEYFKATNKDGKKVEIDVLDILATCKQESGEVAVAVINKHPKEEKSLSLVVDNFGEIGKCHMYYLSGKEENSFNDVDHNDVLINTVDLRNEINNDGKDISVNLKPHSVNIIVIGK
ncbi:MAG: hypothetical protein JW976_08695 [Syntrophaceae bacterium]|nr:hypothetical protein [Syntrophaceae bacterium]